MKWYCDRCYEKVPRNTSICPTCGFNHFVKEVEKIDLRDFFAGCALVANVLVGMPVCVNESAHEGAARIAYGYADAMMKEREK